MGLIPFELLQLLLVFLDLALNILLVVLDVDEFIAHLAHYDCASDS